LVKTLTGTGGMLSDESLPELPPFCCWCPISKYCCKQNK